MTQAKQKAKLWPAAIWLPGIVLATFFVYRDLLQTHFFLDDYLHLLLIQKFKQPLEPFYTDIFMGAFFRPAVTIFWALDYALHGTNPAGYYLSNILYLMLSIGLLYAVMHNLTGSHTLAGLTAFFFAVSPVTGVGVEWLSNRFDLIGTLFFLASTLLFLRFVRFRRKSDYALSLFAAVVAFFCKEITITLPVVLIFAASFMFLYRYPPAFDARLVKKIISYTTPYFSLAAIYMIWRFAVIKSLGGYVGEAKDPLTIGYLFMIWQKFGEYVWLIKNPFVVASLLIIITFLLAKADFYAKNKVFFLGLLIALVTALPLAMIIKYRAVMTYMTPRFFFLPNIGATIALVAIYDPRSSKLRRVLAAILLVTIGLALGVNNYIIVHKWARDKNKTFAKMEQITRAMAEQSPSGLQSAMVYTCLPGLDVALDTSVKFTHPEYLDRYFFLNCQGATQTIADKTLYQAKRRLLEFPQSFAKNPCSYENVIYGVAEALPNMVLDQIRSDDAVLVLDLNQQGETVFIDRDKVEQMIRVRYGAESETDGDQPNA